MNLSDIRNVALIAELGSLSRASLRLNVPQPTLSRHLGALEADLGAPLFHRTGRGAELTAFGRSFLDSFAPILNDIDQRRAELVASLAQESGLVRLGIPPQIGRSIGASIVTEFNRRCPQAQLQLVEAFSGLLAEWIEDGTLDMAVLYDTKRSAHLAVSPLLNEQVYLVETGDRSDPFLPDSVALSQIDTARLLLPSLGQGMRRAVEQAFAEAQVPLTCAMQIDSVATMKELVETAGFCALLPYGAMHRELVQGRLRAAPVLEPTPLCAPLVLGTASSRPITPAARSLIAVIEDQVHRFVTRGILRGTHRRASAQS